MKKILIFLLFLPSSILAQKAPSPYSFWKVSVSGTADFALVKNIRYDNYKDETNTSFNCRFDFGSEKWLGELDAAGNFVLSSEIDDDNKKYTQAFRANGEGKFSSHHHVHDNGMTDCNGGEKAWNTDKKEVMTANIPLDLTGTTMSFNYNKESGVSYGDFNFGYLAEKIQANGLATFKEIKCEPQSTELDLKELANANALSLLLAYGNYVISTENDENLKAIANQTGKAFLGNLSVSPQGKGFILVATNSHAETKEIPNGNETMTVSNKITFVLTPYEEEEYEAFLEPMNLIANYEEFIPLGPKIVYEGIQDGVPNVHKNGKMQGNSVAFWVKVYRKGETNPISGDQYQAGMMLEKVSNYRGYCNNFPHKNDNPDTKPDFRVLTDFNSASDFETLTEAGGITKMGYGDKALIITSFDYAAYAQLRANVTLKNGKSIPVKYKPTGDAFVNIPKDNNHNHIADKWEKEVGMEGYAEKWDEDAFPKGQRRKGDGYTFFEEYRGFSVESNLLKKAENEQFEKKYLRMDPNYKDVFVYDEDGVFQQYYAPYNPAELNWHYVNKTQITFIPQANNLNSRQTNFNESPYKHAHQYAVHIVKRDQSQGATSLGGSLGVTFGSPNDLVPFQTADMEQPGMVDRFTELVLGALKAKELPLPSAPDGSPNNMKNLYIIEIYQGVIENIVRVSVKPIYYQQLFNNIMTTCVNHEVGHQLGIEHHRTAEYVETAESIKMGVSDCAMRYVSPAERNHRISTLIQKTRYCRKEETYKVFDESQQPNFEETGDQGMMPIPFKSFPAHNCWGQIDVKSDD